MQFTQGLKGGGIETVEGLGFWWCHGVHTARFMYELFCVVVTLDGMSDCYQGKVSYMIL